MREGDLHIRPATLADAVAVRDLTRSAYAKWVPMIGREPKPMGADYEAAIQTHRIDLLLAGDEPVALIEMIPEEDCLLVENIAVAPDHQGRGYGRRLMAHAEQVAVGLGFARIRLYTNRRFEENVRLYLSLGYYVEREEIMANGVSVHMRKDVSRLAERLPDA